RVGRSGYAVTAAGYNAGKYYVDAFVHHRPAPAEPAIAGPAHLFAAVPLRLLKSYAPRWKAKIDALKKRQAVTNPYYYRAEKHPKRWLYILVAMANQYRKFARHHPRGRKRAQTPGDGELE